MNAKGKAVEVLLSFGYPTDKIRIAYSTGAVGVAKYSQVRKDVPERARIDLTEVEEVYSSHRKNMVLANKEREQKKLAKLPGSRRGVKLSSLSLSEQMNFGRAVAKMGGEIAENFTRMAIIGWRVEKGLPPIEKT